MAEISKNPHQQVEPPGQVKPNVIDLNIADMDDDCIPAAILAADSRLNPDFRLLSLERRRAADMTVFPIEQESFTPLPRPNHCSLAWSDLMMTMFVLFFVLFLNKSEKVEQLETSRPEVIAASAQQTPVRTTIFLRDMQGKTTATSGKKIRQTVAVSVPSPEKEKPPQPVVLDGRSDTPVRHPLKAPSYTAPGQPQRIPGSVGEVAEVVDHGEVEEKGEKIGQTENNQPPKETQQTVAPLSPAASPEPSFEEVYNRGQAIVQQNSLDDFAAIDLVPDQPVRLILTGDLLFPSAQATLTPEAEYNLEKLAEIIAQTHYMVNIEGHTDDRPISSDRFPSNWELSVARAGSVARFLIDKVGLDPQQVVVSGYSSYRPATSNETEAGRAKNRRVEIILSHGKNENNQRNFTP